MLKTQRVVLSTSSVQPFDSSNWTCTLGGVENVVLGPLCRQGSRKTTACLDSAAKLNTLRWRP